MRFAWIPGVLALASCAVGPAAAADPGDLVSIATSPGNRSIPVPDMLTATSWWGR